MNLTGTSDCHCGAGMAKDAAPALKKFSLSVKKCRIDLLNFCKVRHTGTEPINVRYSL